MSDWAFARICKHYEFSAGHFLPNVPDGHPCKRQHGHNYKVEIEIRGEIHPQSGMVQDFAKIDETIKPLIAKLDHMNLNDVIENPTAENLALWFMAEYPLKNIWRVRIWETPRCWAEVVNEEGSWPRFHRA